MARRATLECDLPDKTSASIRRTAESADLLAWALLLSRARPLQQSCQSTALQSSLMTGSSHPKGKRQEKGSGAQLIFHTMAIEENFERCAHRLHEMVKGAQRLSPGAPRILILRVDGHRNDAGGFDRDAFEIIKDFALKYLGPYLTEYYSPYSHLVNRRRQLNDIPEELTILSPPDQSPEYDVQSLALRSREERPLRRSSAPTVAAIADYIGIAPPRCLICMRTPVERAHVVPRSLGGSYDLRNFALLCGDHHRQSPDIADAEAFWAWIDYMVMRRSSLKRKGASPDHPKMLGIRLPHIDGAAEDQAQFVNILERELVELYGWGENEFASVTWKVNVELHSVLESATGYHFGVSRKASTYAWAYDAALRRSGVKRSPYFPTY
jgi:5-methylcytosine-specific restriction endonuclease McrA